MNRIAAPTSVRIIAAIFAFEGIGSIARMIVGYFRNEYILDFGVVGLLIAYGLMALNNTWRIVAVVILWIALAADAAFAVALALITGTITWRIAGANVGGASRAQACAIVIATFVVVAWMIWSLSRSRIRTRFVGKGVDKDAGGGAPATR